MIYIYGEFSNVLLTISFAMKHPIYFKKIIALPFDSYIKYIALINALTAMTINKKYKQS